MAAVPTLSVMEEAESVRVIVWEGGEGGSFARFMLPHTVATGAHLGSLFTATLVEWHKFFFKLFFLYNTDHSC